MRDGTVGEIMTTEVAAVRRQTPFRDVIAVMVARGISAVPVLDDDGRPVGVVSEADLLAAGESRGGVERPRHHDPASGREEWRRAQAATAGELMTPRVITVADTDPLIVAARRLARARVRHVFVVDGAGRLIGVVARRDLLRPFLRADEVIRDEVQRELRREIPYSTPSELSIRVDGGVVTLAGHLERRSQARLAERVARATNGVIDVHNTLRFDRDDLPPDRA